MVDSGSLVSAQNTARDIKGKAVNLTVDDLFSKKLNKTAIKDFLVKKANGTSGQQDTTKGFSENIRAILSRISKKNKSHIQSGVIDAIKELKTTKMAYAWTINDAVSDVSKNINKSNPLFELRDAVAREFGVAATSWAGNVGGGSLGGVNSGGSFHDLHREFQSKNVDGDGLPQIEGNNSSDDPDGVSGHSNVTGSTGNSLTPPPKDPAYLEALSAVKGMEPSQRSSLVLDIKLQLGQFVDDVDTSRAAEFNLKLEAAEFSDEFLAASKIILGLEKPRAETRKLLLEKLIAFYPDFNEFQNILTVTPVSVSRSNSQACRVGGGSISGKVEKGSALPSLLNGVSSNTKKSKSSLKDLASAAWRNICWAAGKVSGLFSFLRKNTDDALPLSKPGIQEKGGAGESKISTLGDLKANFRKEFIEAVIKTGRDRGLAVKIVEASPIFETDDFKQYLRDNLDELTDLPDEIIIRSAFVKDRMLEEAKDVTRNGLTLNSLQREELTKLAVEDQSDTYVEFKLNFIIAKITSKFTPSETAL